MSLVPHSDILRFEEIAAIVDILIRDFGIRKIRITGGEPLLRRNLPALVERLASMGPEELVLTTNGLLLPGCAHDLACAGLGRVNISLDSLRDEVLAAVCRAGTSVCAVEDAVRSAKLAGLEPVRVNCVLIPGVNTGEVVDFIIWADEMGVEVRFIEMMPGSPEGPSGAEMVLRAASSLGDPVEIPGIPGEVQRTWRIDGTDFGFGLIAPVSDRTFCSRCRRIRLSASGELVTCLGQAQGVDLRTPLREGSPDVVAGLIRAALASKPAGHDGCIGHGMWRTGG